MCFVEMHDICCRIRRIWVWWVYGVLTKLFFIAMEQRNQVLMCERPVLFCGFVFWRLIFKLWIFFSGLVHWHAGIKRTQISPNRPILKDAFNTKDYNSITSTTYKYSVCHSTCHLLFDFVHFPHSSSCTVYLLFLYYLSETMEH